MGKARISIITVCLNSENTIERTLKSVIKQDYDNIEYIIIDGKSIDNTLDIVKRYEENISLVISEKDEGIYDAMNKGLAISSGDIVAFINSDDWYESGIIKKAMECFESEDVDIVFGDYFINDNGKEILRSQKYVNVESLLKLENLCHQSIFVKRTWVEKYGGFDIRYKIAADKQWLLKAALDGVRMHYMKMPICTFSANGFSKRRILEGFEEIYNIAITIYGKNDTRFLPVIQKRLQAELVYQHIVDELKKDCLNKQHVRILHDFCRESAIYVYGAGRRFAIVWEYLRKMGVTVAGVIDNDMKKWGENEEGIIVYAPEILKSAQKRVFVSTTIYIDEIESQLKEMGFEEGKDFIDLASLAV